jgi:hypothetical protein
LLVLAVCARVAFETWQQRKDRETPSEEMFVAVVHLYDLARELVTGNGRKVVRTLRKYARHVRAAYAGGAHAKERLVRGYTRNRDIFIPEISYFVKYARFHVIDHNILPSIGITAQTMGPPV